jgi:hypothetical protein
MICVCAHDAGGAEILSSYVREHKVTVLCALGGPAVDIFKRKLLNYERMELSSALERADWLLCGSSWQSDLEWSAICAARKMGKRSVVFLDHWVNYRERFVRNGVENLPDEIWVGDEYAARKARDDFASTPVKMTVNPYFDELRLILKKSGVKQLRERNSIQILYVCEPIREHALRQHGDERYWNYTEEEALFFFLSNINVLSEKAPRIVLRRHPSESSYKYKNLIKLFPLLSIAQGGVEPLINEIIASDLVVGCETMAMVVGLLAERRVVSSIPPGGRECVLPHREIEKLKDLVHERVKIF